MTKKRLMRCLVCNREMRPYGVSKHEAPGTLAHQGRGLCSKHYVEARANGFEGFPSSQPPSKRPEVEVVRSSRNPVIDEPDPYHEVALRSFLERRRDRQAKVGQCLKVRDEQEMIRARFIVSRSEAA